MKSVNKRELVWMTYPRALKYMSIAGLICGGSGLWLVLNRLWLHWPFAIQLFLFANAYFIFACVQMMLASKRSLPMVIMWLGMAIMSLAFVFISLFWPGGFLLAYKGIPALITIVATVVYLIQMPQEYQWSKKALGTWVICILIAFAALVNARIYYWEYMMDDFEPAIPYAYDSILHEQRAMWNMKVFVFGNSLVMFLSSCYLYIVTCIQQKKIKNG